MCNHSNEEYSGLSTSLISTLPRGDRPPGWALRWGGATPPVLLGHEWGYQLPHGPHRCCQAVPDLPPQRELSYPPASCGWETVPHHAVTPALPQGPQLPVLRAAAMPAWPCVLTQDGVAGQQGNSLSPLSPMMAVGRLPSVDTPCHAMLY